MSGRRANEGMIVLGKKSKLPSPCVGICKEKRGVCIACGRDEDDEKAWKRADGLAEKLALLADCSRNTQKLGTRQFWEAEYRRKCLKKGVSCPLDGVRDVTTPTPPNSLLLN